MEHTVEDLETADTVCECGNRFEFFSGNRCPVCGELFCEDCVETCLVLCPACKAMEYDIDKVI